MKRSKYEFQVTGRNSESNKRALEKKKKENLIVLKITQLFHRKFS